jgi:hypothetical protein
MGGVLRSPALLDLLSQCAFTYSLPRAPLRRKWNVLNCLMNSRYDCMRGSFETAIAFSSPRA